MRLWLLTDTTLKEYKEELKNLKRLHGGPIHFYMDIERKLLEVIKELEYRNNKNKTTDLS